MIEYKELSHRDDYELKLNCLDGAIKYLDYKRFGHMDVKIENEVPLVPYSVWVEKYNGELIEMLRTSRKAKILRGDIDKSVTAEELKIYVHNAEGELKKELIYKNEEDYVEKDAEVILPEFEGIITQDDTDTIKNNTVRFFIYTDLNNWGFFVFPIQRKNDQLYLGRKQYFPYEDNLNEISYFDGEH
jgi:molecular chaperone-like protein